MTSETLRQNINKLVNQITEPFPGGRFKEAYREIFAEELLKAAEEHYTPEQQEKFVEVVGFLQEVGPEKYSKIQAQVQGAILRRLVEAGFDE